MINFAALADSAHAQHHFSLGQLFGYALLGLAAYQQQDAPNSGGPSIFLQPTVLGQYLSGVLSIANQQPTTPPVA